MAEALAFLARHNTEPMRNLAAGMYTQGAAATWMRFQLLEAVVAPEYASCEVLVGRRRIVLEGTDVEPEIEWRGAIVLRSHLEPRELLAYYERHLAGFARKLRAALPFVTGVDLAEDGLWTVAMLVWVNV